MKEKNHSQARACALAGIELKVYCYRPKRRDAAAIRKRLRERSCERRWFGYRRLLILHNGCEGFAINHKSCTACTGKNV